MKIYHWMIRFLQVVLVVASMAAFFFETVPGEAAEQKTSEVQKVPAKPASEAIPLAEVASRATEVEALLRTFETLGAPSRKIAAVQSRLPAESARLGLELQRTLSILRGHPTLEWLEGAQELWEGWQRPMTTWLHGLTQRAAQLQGGLTRLADEQQTWTQTQDAARAAGAPGPILEQIAEVLAAIESAQKALLAQRATVLELQSRIAQGVSRCQTALAQIDEAQKQVLEGLLMQDHPPLWSGELWSAWPEGFRRARDNAISWCVGITLSLRNPGEGNAPMVVFFLVLAVLLWAARRRWVRREAAAEETPSFGAAVFDRPFSAALLLAVFGHTIVYGAPRPVVRDLVGVLLLVPMIRLTTPFVDPRVVPGLFMLGTLFAFDTVRRVLVGGLVLEPALLALEMLAGLLGLGYTLTVGPLRRPPARDAESERLRATRVVGTLALVLFATGLACTVLGYVHPGRLLASGVLGSAYLALLLNAGIRVLTGVAALVFRMWPVRLLGMVQYHRDLLERRTYRVLVWLAVVAWTLRSLAYVGLLGTVVGLGQSLLAAKLERGSISISVEDILAFLLTVWVSYLLSAFIRFVLQEDVYPRMRMPRGLSYAISSLLNYVLLALGVVVGMGVMGVSLSRVTVLAGAFGVGIGFGLQSIVNNFASGLILLFEKPVHVGDTVEIGALQGEVKRIGIRSSVVRTSVGSDIIVPNSRFVTEQVTNWTLSDRLRRVDLPVGVNYGAEPRKVIELLEQVAVAHPDLLQTPPPRTFFTGFGDSSINFELRVWTEDFEKWYQIRSELAVAVYDAGNAAGISFPFPQREVRLLRDPDPGRDMVARAEGSKSLLMKEQTEPKTGKKGGSDPDSGT